MPSRSKCSWFRGSLTRATTFGHAVLLAGELADDDVVLVVARRGDEDVGRPRDPGLLEDEDLRAVAGLDLVLELLLELLEAIAALLDERHLVAHAR